MKASHVTGLRRYYLMLSVIYLWITRVNSGDFKIGLLGPWDDTGSHIYPLLGSRTVGAVPLALEQIKDEGILGNHNVTFIYRDTKCDTRRASGSAVDLHLINGVDAFIGLPCSEPCRSVRDLTAYWNKPFVSWFCPNTNANPSDDKYQSFARTYVPFSRISELPLTLMNYFEWDSVSLVFAKSGTWEVLKEKVVYGMINSGVEIAQIQEYDKPLLFEAAVSILQKLKLVSHVIWLVIGGITTLESDEQIFMLAADYLGMVDGDQVFLRLELYPDPGYDTPWSPVIVPKNFTNTDLMEPGEDAMRRAYESMLIVTYRLPDDGRIEKLFERIPDAELPFDYKMPNYTKVSIMSAFLYDAVLLCAHAAIYQLDRPTHGDIELNYTRPNITFEGKTGYVMFDSDGDRIANFSLLDLKGGTNFEAVGYISGLQLEYEPIAGEEISWPGALIPREPKCGYNGEKCLDSSIITAIVVGAVLTLVVVIMIPYISFKYRKYIYRKDWQIEIDELTFLSMQQSTLGVQGYPSMYRLPNVSGRLLSQPSLTGRSFHQDNAGKTGETKAPDCLLAKYKSETVLLRKSVLGNNLSLNKATKKELKEMRWLVNENLIRFVGVCFPTRGGNDFYYISEYCTKGNLKNILANDDIKLDLSFKVSFIKDLARGMQFLHNTVIKSHGLLCSNLCYLDSRWVLKIAGSGVVSFHMSKGTGEKIIDPEARFAKLLWTSPELLRHELPPKGSQKGDVYSFGVLIEEILSRSVPYQEAGLSSKVIIRRVMKREEPPFRPQMTASTDDWLSTQLSQSADSTVARLIELRTQCWEEHPEDRPDFNVVRHRLRSMEKKGKEQNLMDSMVEKMEKYTENLEHVVANRTAQLLEEKKKTDALLYRMLPQAVADELKKGQLFPGEFYDQVTLYFSDIVGFTELSAMSTPMEVVDFLNDLYTCFDAILETFDVYKVETIGDAYMVASGLPRRNGNRHASEIASMALAVREGVKSFKVRHLPERKVEIRIGINSGPVAAGVVGLMMPRFCLFGDTVNTASRMESHGLPQRIHVSWSAAALLTNIGGYRLEVRGQMKIKRESFPTMFYSINSSPLLVNQGKGMMTTFWLLGKDEQLSATMLQDGNLSYSVKKISTDTVISEDSLLSPSNNDTQDVTQDSLIISRVPEEELPSDLGSELSSPTSSPRKRRIGNGNANHDLSRQDRTDILQTTRNSSPRNSDEVQDARTPQQCSDITTLDDTPDCDMNTTEKCDITSTRDGEYVRAQKCLVVRTQSGEITTSPIKRPSSRLVNESTNMPNVPNLPDIVFNDDLLSENQQNSVFKYTVPLPQLMSEISSHTQESQSINTTEFKRNKDSK